MHKIHTIKLQNPIDHTTHTVSFSSADSLKAFGEKVAQAQPSTQFAKDSIINWKADHKQAQVRTADIYDSAEEAFEVFQIGVAQAARTKLGDAGLKALGLAKDDIPFD